MSDVNEIMKRLIFVDEEKYLRTVNDYIETERVVIINTFCGKKFELTFNNETEKTDFLDNLKTKNKNKTIVELKNYKCSISIS